MWPVMTLSLLLQLTEEEQLYAQATVPVDHVVPDDPRSDHDKETCCDLSTWFEA